MSEERPTYIRCVSGHNAQAECQAVRHGDLVRIVTPHPDSQFLPDDATALAVALNRIATEIKQESAPPP